jgi:signal transduction histidine kinase
MLAAREEELERAHAGLERRVRERTEQLSQTIRALQEQIRERQRTEAELVESRGRLRALSMGLESAREEERAHLSRELHDELGQMMTALMVEISTLKKRPRQDAASRVGLSKMTRMVDDTIRVVRRIAKSLRPGMLDDLGLVAALEWQLQEFQENTRIKTVFEVEPENIELDGTRSTCIFRIVQEALTNIARHAKATQVRAALRRDASWIHLEVSDNGRGIRDEEAARASGLGLVGIRERALLCGGEAVIRGVSGKGTVLQVRLPSSYDPDTHLRRPHHRP